MTRSKTSEPSTSPTSREPNIAVFTVLFIIGVVFSKDFSPNFNFFLLSLIFVFSIAGYFFGKRKSWEASKIFLFSAAVFVGMYTGIQGTPPAPPSDILNSLADTDGEISGVFNRDFSKSGKEGFSFLLNDVDLTSGGKDFRLPFLVRLKVSNPEFFPEPGVRYSASGTFKVEKRRLAMVCKNYRIVPQEILLSLSGTTREWIKDGFKSMLSPRHHALLSGFLIGDTSKLSYSDRELFRKTGITHLLAVSGQQVMSLAFLLAAILSWTGIPPLSRGFVISGFLFFFGLMTGGQSSVWRALIMYVAGFIIWNLESEPNPMVPLSISALVLLLYQPTLIYDLGFQLSFLAVLGIIFVREPIEKMLARFGIPLLLARYIAVSTGANIATIPISAWHFQYISFSSFIINPLVVWLFSVVLPMGLAVSIVGHFWFNGGLIIAAALSLIIDSMMTMVEFVSRFPFAILTISNFHPLILVGIYALILFTIDYFTSVPGEISTSGPSSVHTSIPAASQALTQAGTPAFKKNKESGKSYLLIEKEEPQVKRKVSAVNRKMRFFDSDLLNILEVLLSQLPKRSLKSKGNIELLNFPVSKLSVDGQTFFHRLDDLTAEILTREPQRIIQAQLFCLALFCMEFAFDNTFTAYCKSFCSRQNEALGKEKRDRALLICMAFEAFPRPISEETEGNNIPKYPLAREIFQDGLELLGSQIFQKSTSKDDYLSMIKDHMDYRKRVLNQIRGQFAK
ncbi:MAG: ComEC/Rec2 family competence protein [Candidatus Riflebacteria bacterium]|nr:ComEC/Rec2 family competence protein [Candidatus Riflebacteria bacterium]